MIIDKVTTVLLAGDPKCLRPIRVHFAETYLDRSLEVARELGFPLVAVCHDAVPDQLLKNLYYVPAGETLTDSLAAGLQACQTKYALVIATDLPYISKPSLGEFLLQAMGYDADICFSLANLQDCRALGHDTRHPIPLEGKRFKFGSVFLLCREAFPKISATAPDLLGLRKEPIKLVTRFSIWRSPVAVARFILSYRFPRLGLSFDEASRVIEDRTGLAARAAIVSPYLAIDHD